MIRRSFLRKLAAVPLFAAAAAVPAATTKSTKLKILLKSAWGSDDPTKAAFPFLHGDVLSEAGHDVQIFLLGEGVSLMRKSVANAVVPVGWPPLAEVLAKLRSHVSRLRFRTICRWPLFSRSSNCRWDLM